MRIGLFFAPRLPYIRCMNRRTLIAGAVALAGVAAFAAPPAAVANEARELARISAYLNSITTLTGDFVQIDPDGILSEGRFYMSRPGRIRFEYKDPNPALVVSDGFWVGVQDKRYGNVERYPLSETPLNLILKENVDLRREGAVEGVQVTDGQMRVRARDPEHADRGSITMIFGSNPLELRQWIIDDAQGGATTVALSAMRANVEIAPSQFVVPEPKRSTGFDK